jgi:hypothetical protein
VFFPLYDLENLPYLAAGVLGVLCLTLLLRAHTATALRAWETAWARAVRFRYPLVMLAAIAVLAGGHAWLGEPLPWVMDENSYLLAADTFAQGRLANPPHPLGEFFEAPYVLQRPTYASIYQPGPGLMLALGQRAGHPWYGVALTNLLLALALLWALDAWFPPQWAMAGALLGVALFASSYWAHTFWGGSLAAIGGAVVTGAAGRFRRAAAGKWSAAAAAGGIMLLAVRPAEGAALSLACGAYLLLLAARRGHWRALLPALAVTGIGLAAQAYYDWRVTGDPLLPPYLLGTRQQVSRRFFIWQTHRPAPPAPHPFLAEVARMQYRSELTGGARFRAQYLPLADHFGGSLWLLPLALLSWLWRGRRLRILFLLTAPVLLLNLLTEWVHPHYAAPAAAGLLAVLVQALRRLRTFTWGRPLAWLLLVAALLGIPPARLHQQKTANARNAFPQRRARFQHDLEARPGPQLIIVRYHPGHSPHEDWVYNRADIDHAKLVWARDYGEERNRRILDHYPSRDAWLWEPDRDQLTLIRAALR